MASSDKPDTVKFIDYFKTLNEFKMRLKLSPKDLMTAQWVEMMIQRIQDAELIVDEQGYSSLHENIKSTLRTYLVSMKDKKKTLILKPIPGKEHRSKTIVPLEETYKIVQKAHALTNHGSSQQINAFLESNNILISDICAEVYCKLYAEFLSKSLTQSTEQDIAEIESAVHGITCPTTTHKDLHHLQSSPQLSTTEHIPSTNHTEKCVPESPLTIDTPLNQDTQITTIQNKPKKQDVETDKAPKRLKKTLPTIIDKDVSFETACTVDVIDISENPDNLYKYLLIYQDKTSNYIQLRPLNANTEDNITVELIKIFMDFGSPKYLIVDIENLMMYRGIVERIKMLTKTETKLTHNKTINPLIQIVSENIVEWIKEEDCSNWGTGCNVVQWNMNNTVDPMGNTPFSNVFGFRYKGSAYKSKFKSSGFADYSDEDDLNIALEEVAIDMDHHEDRTVKRARHLETSGRSEELHEASDKAVTASNKESGKANEEPKKAGKRSKNESYIVTVTEDVIKSEITDLCCLDFSSQDTSEED